MVGTAAAIANAISHATGKRVRDIDAAAQIRLFRKLKLTKCARAERRAGLFCVRAEEHLSFLCHAAIAGLVGRNRLIAPLREV
ncbi:MAG TPA: hypothetical protein VG291_08355 [Xanthobacteraceae bacterium]|nr:hypothetical protein [Xanthobacteraceae bacterium]